jgi:protein-S-isoprenylcysteine O-methyltransferase Ste14
MDDAVGRGDPVSTTTSEQVRSRFSLSVRSLLGAAWFSLWFFVVFPGLILFWSGQSWELLPGYPFWLGIGLIAIAHVVLAAEIAAFVRWGGTHIPLDPPPSLVGSGLYGRVRNPMYTCYLAVVVGEAIAFRSWWLFGYSVVLAIFMHIYVVAIEEPGLLRRFGDDYQRYTASSGRWFPRVRHSPKRQT